MIATNIDIALIQEKLQDGLMTPSQLGEAHMTLAGWYSHYSEAYENLLAQRPKEWKMIKEGVKTNKEADREYEATEHGIDLMRLKHTMDRIDKMIAAIKSMIYVKNREYAQIGN